ncbi:MAG: hypothetical protein AW08_02439 [Candidatus Accumulibacter adjunctus]|uniref:Uncharacterized protein n=1 Tax=Candidatus Accumulibacter adjunctus TaxID=1454001 RepID=A0A011NQF0_9PROT|nr:MAG: hypothetical protein AW08_02439 [Candidatus Accumulibacter adjunctus]
MTCENMAADDLIFGASAVGRRSRTSAAGFAGTGLIRLRKEP